MPFSIRKLLIGAIKATFSPPTSAIHTCSVINAETDNLPVDFINHSDHEIVIPKLSYVRAMEKVEESDEDILLYSRTLP